MKIFAALGLSLTLFASSALPITFNFTRALTTEAEAESGSMTRGGLTATLTPLVEGPKSGVLNQTTTSFGINAEGADQSALLDGAQGVESILVSFDAAVTLQAFDFSSFGSSDTANLTIGSFGTQTLSGYGGDFLFTTNNLIQLGETFHLTWVSDDSGFSFDEFSVELVSVPEAGATLTFLGLTAFGLILFRRFQK